MLHEINAFREFKTTFSENHPISRENHQSKTRSNEIETFSSVQFSINFFTYRKHIPIPFKLNRITHNKQKKSEIEIKHHKHPNASTRKNNVKNITWKFQNGNADPNHKRKSLRIAVLMYLDFYILFVSRSRENFNSRTYIYMALIVWLCTHVNKRRLAVSRFSLCLLSSLSRTRFVFSLISPSLCLSL